MALSAAEIQGLQAGGHGKVICDGCGGISQCRCSHGGQIPVRHVASCYDCQHPAEKAERDAILARMRETSRADVAAGKTAAYIPRPTNPHSLKIASPLAVGISLAGAGLGYGAGGLLGNMLLPDDEHLSMNTRHSRAGWRGGIRDVGTIGGAIGGALLSPQVASAISAAGADSAPRPPSTRAPAVPVRPPTPSGNAARAQPVKPLADFQFPDRGRTTRMERLGDQIEHYYGGRDGLDTAIADAQWWQSQRPTNSPLSAFKKWLPADVDRDVPVSYGALQPAGRDGRTVGGMYSPTDDSIKMLPQSDIASALSRVALSPEKKKLLGNVGLKGVLDHELTHALTASASPLALVKMRPAPLSDTYTQGIGSDERNYLEYATTPAEMDPRLAAIKRLYTYNTGRAVNTPEEAAKAIQYGTARPPGTVVISPDIESRGMLEMDKTFNKWLNANPKAKHIGIMRMLELVQGGHKMPSAGKTAQPRYTVDTSFDNASRRKVADEELSRRLRSGILRLSAVGGLSPNFKLAADEAAPSPATPMAVRRVRAVMPYGDGYLMERMNNPKYPAALGRQRFPGGGVDAGEIPSQAVIRELMEELSINVDPAQLSSLGIHQGDYGPEEYFHVNNHGLVPGTYTANKGGDKNIELLGGKTTDPHYWGGQLNQLASDERSVIPRPVPNFKLAADEAAPSPAPALSAAPALQLKSPGAFPASNNPIQTYVHPSGARQLGALTYDTSDGVKPGIFESPGTLSGPGVLHIGLHGGGDATDGNYRLGNYAASGEYTRQESGLATRNALIQPDSPISLRADTRPRTILSTSCNADINGATPASYASGLGRQGGALNRVAMVPSGNLGAGQVADLRSAILGLDDSAVGRPDAYATPAVIPSGPHAGKTISALHDYRLLRGGDPQNANHWTDTGIYNEGSQAPMPLINGYAEAREIGRHLGLGEQLGGGDFNSYLDKVVSINKNPDATYPQVMRSNFTRPVGSIAATARETGGLVNDLRTNARMSTQNAATQRPQPLALNRDPEASYMAARRARDLSNPEPQPVPVPRPSRPSGSQLGTMASLGAARIPGAGALPQPPVGSVPGSGSPVASSTPLAGSRLMSAALKAQPAAGNVPRPTGP